MKTLNRNLTIVFAICLIGATAVSQTTKTWRGYVNNNWSEPGNWSPSGVPGASDSVIISQFASCNPNLDADESCAYVLIEWSRTLNFSSAGKTLAVSGDFVIYGGGSASFGADATLKIGGSFFNGNVFTASMGTVVMKGDVFNGSGPITFNNLTIEKAGLAYVWTPITVNGALVFNSGKLILENGNNLIIGSEGTISGASSSRYIITDGTGVVTRDGVSTSATSFPVGTASSYNPVTIQAEHDMDSYGVRVISGVSPSSANDSYAVQRTWVISQENPGSTGTSTFSVQWNSGEQGTGFARSVAQGWENSGAGWGENGELVSITPEPVYPAVATISATTMGNWTVAGGGALPIQLVSSAANVVRDNQVEVTWKTVSETNNYGFEIYRKRSEATEWTKIGFVEGHGTTLAPQSYSYVDASLTFGKYYYQIRQVDLDGTSETLPTMEVTVGAGVQTLTLAQNYPNPFNPSTVIEFVVPQTGLATMKVYNVLGQEVATLFQGNAEAGRINTARFNASNLPSGLYFYTLKSAGQTETKRMLLTK
jgi:hypothetical protein